MNTLPFISVIMAVHNRAQTLDQALESVINQTYPHKELLIIDGGSTDGSVDIIRRYSESINYWVSEPDRGIYDAWNKALEKVSGDWVIFLGADDYFWDDQVLEEAAWCLNSLAQNIGIFYGRVNLVNYEGVVLSTVYKDWEEAKKELKYRMSIPHQGVFHRSSLFERYGYFDDSFQIIGDYDFLLRVLKNTEVHSCNDLIVTAMRYGGISSSFKTGRLKLKENIRAKKKNNLNVINYNMVRRVFMTYGRELLIIIFGNKKAEQVERKMRKMIKKQNFWDHI